jgi:hypothetical protein
MKIRDLPREKLEYLLAICAEAELSCKGILDFDIEDLELYIRAAAEDRDRRIEVRRKWLALTDELDGLIDPIRTEYPDPCASLPAGYPPLAGRRLYKPIPRLRQPFRLPRGRRYVLKSAANRRS